MTAAIALGVLFYLNWRLTTVTLVILGVFGGGMAFAFTRLRPIFRERGKINAEVTGRLGESLGGIRIVKAYMAERREQLVFTARRAPAVPQHRQDDHRHLGAGRGLHRHHRRHRRADDRGRRPRDPRRAG